MLVEDIKSKMKEGLFIYSPAIIGINLVAASMLEFYLVKTHHTFANVLLNIQLFIVVLGIGSIMAAFILTIKSLFQQQWYKTLRLFVSMLIFFIGFIIAGNKNAAFLYAT